VIVIEERRFRDTKPRSSAFLAELARFDNSQNVKMMTSDQIEPILFLAGDDSAEESAKRRESSDLDKNKAMIVIGARKKPCSWIVFAIRVSGNFLP